MNGLTAFIVLLANLFIIGCRRDAIETYRVPKESVSPAVPTMPTPAGMEPSTELKKQIRWKTPSGWKEQPPSAMRVGSFSIQNAAGQADVSIVPLSGDSGGDLANINRWRGQIQLPALTAETLKHESQTRVWGGHRMLWVDFSNADKRITAAIYKEGGVSWFFKMTGDDAVVKGAQSAFEELLHSTDFAGHAH